MLPRQNAGMPTAVEREAPTKIFSPASEAELWAAGTTADNES
jgi:hypothetical protein